MPHRKIEKYANLQETFPNLQPVLVDAIQSDFLEIQPINTECEKFQEATKSFDNLDKAHSVIYSKFVKKADHAYEKFIFIDETGKEVCHVEGRDMALYGLFSSCVSLQLSQEYAEALAYGE